jgi:hypothetical protein
LASAVLVVAVLLGSKLVGPVGGCGDAAASACSASPSATPGKILGSAWLLRDRSSYRPL